MSFNIVDSCSFAPWYINIIWLALAPTVLFLLIALLRTFLLVGKKNDVIPKTSEWKFHKFEFYYGLFWIAWTIVSFIFEPPRFGNYLYNQVSKPLFSYSLMINGLLVLVCLFLLHSYSNSTENDGEKFDSFIAGEHGLNILLASLLALELAYYIYLHYPVFFVDDPISGFFTGPHLVAFIAQPVVHILLAIAAIILLAVGWRHGWIIFLTYSVYYLVLESFFIRVQPNGPLYYKWIDEYRQTLNNGPIDNIPVKAGNTSAYPNWITYLIFLTVAGLLLTSYLKQRNKSAREDAS